MIEKNEVLKMATELGLRPDTIEKDYVLGWMLWGINRHPAVSGWAFKGGTSLKKCHFETFRFSEDLDFTLTDPSHLTNEFLTQAFVEITELLSEEVGIEFFSDRFTFKVKEKGQGQLSALGKIHLSIEQHEKLDELEPQWAHMLAHQLPFLPPMESFWAELPAFFEWLAGLQAVEVSRCVRGCLQSPCRASRNWFQAGRRESSVGGSSDVARSRF